MQDYKERIIVILMDKLSVKREVITPDARFKEDLGADSLDVAELIVEFENEFQLTISDQEADEFETVRDAELFIMKKLPAEGLSGNESIL